MSFINNSTVTIMVSDLDRSIHFYLEKLDFSIKQRYGEHYAELEAPGLLIGLHPTSEKIEPGSNMSIGFAVDNFENTKQSLENKDIKVKVNVDGWSTIGHFTDPDKNPLFFIEQKP